MFGWLGGIIYDTGIGFFLSIVPALIVGVVAKGRGYSLLKFGALTSLYCTISFALPFYLLDGNLIAVIVAVVLPFTVMLIWVKRLPRKYVTHQRETL